MVRAGEAVRVSKRSVEDIVDYLCHVGRHVEVFYLWRPFLRDPSDDMVLELAVADACDGIVTHNVRDFAGIEQFGLRLWTPRSFLKETMR